MFDACPRAQETPSSIGCPAEFLFDLIASDMSRKGDFQFLGYHEGKWEPSTLTEVHDSVENRAHQMFSTFAMIHLYLVLFRLRSAPRVVINRIEKLRGAVFKIFTTCKRLLDVVFPLLFIDGKRKALALNADFTKMFAMAMHSIYESPDAHIAAIHGIAVYNEFRPIRLPYADVKHSQDGPREREWEWEPAGVDFTNGPREREWAWEPSGDFTIYFSRKDFHGFVLPTRVLLRDDERSNTFFIDLLWETDGLSQYTNKSVPCKTAKCYASKHFRMYPRVAGGGMCVLVCVHARMYMHGMLMHVNLLLLCAHA
jgi:hypothetical protein